MFKNSCAKMFEIKDSMDYIKEQRKSCEHYTSIPEFEQNKQNWDWMLRWLKESDEKHLEKSKQIDDMEENPYIDSKQHCFICFKPNRYLLTTSFLFDDAYNCPICICKECALKIGEMAKSMIDE